MFPQLHRAFIVDRSLCFFTGVIIFKIYPDINSMVSLKDERRGRFFSDAPPFQVQIYKGGGADVSSVSPSPERLEELWVVRGFICRKWSYAIGGNMVTRKQE